MCNCKEMKNTVVSNEAMLVSQVLSSTGILSETVVILSGLVER